MVKDPVCSMEVDEASPPGGKAQYWGQAFYFCSPACRGTFQRQPQKYAKASEEAAEQPGYDPRMFLGDM